MASTPVRVRFAPSPTGPLHIGGVRTALYNYLFARHHGGTFVLRIEDTDQRRFVGGAEDYIREALAWCGLDPDEGPAAGGPYGPYRQSERSARYAAAARALVAAGRAYYAFDTPAALDAARAAAEAAGGVFRYDAATRAGLDNSLAADAADVERRIANGEAHVVRLRVDPGDEVAFADRVRGTVRFATDELDDKVLLKADGLPTYHLANVVDDRAMAITHVIRGEEWLPSTAHHVLLYRALGVPEADVPTFAHLPLILKPAGKGKLSKRDGATFGVPVFPLRWDDPASGEAFAGFRESGFLPGAVVNFLALLGWNPGTEREVFSLDELAAAFDLDQIGKSGARFDVDKARWFNQQYLMALAPERFAELAGPAVAAAGLDVDAETLARAFPLVRERLHAVDDLPTAHAYLFAAPAAYDERQAGKRLRKTAPGQLAPLADVLRATAPWDAEAVAGAVEGWAAEAGLGLGVLLPLVRVALTGGMSGPDVFALASFLGRDETAARWEAAVAYLEGERDGLG